MKSFLLLVTSFLIVGSGFGIGQIDISYSPYTITLPGSYIVVKDITTAQNLDCIDVMTCNVSIDLNGHTLYGAGSTVGSTGIGILDQFAGARNVSVSNGTIRDFKSFGIFFSNSCEEVKVDGVNFLANGSAGIQSYSNGLISNCNALYNNGYGIAFMNGGVIRNNNVTNNLGDGIHCYFGSNIIGNNASYNKGDGIYASTGSQVLDNILYANQNNGIEMGSNSLTERNTCHLNGMGIYVSNINNAIKNNNLFSNTTGLCISSTGNFYSGNILRSNSVNTSIVAGNSTGNGINGGFGDLIVPYSQPNLMIQNYAGFVIPGLHESPESIIHNLVW